MKHSIPFFSLNRQWEAVKDSILPSLHDLLASNQYIGGPYVATFEKEFAKYIGSLSKDNAVHAIGCNSGTDALWLALKALDITPNSIVLTTPFSFIASSSEIIAHKAYPLFIDIDESYNISPEKIDTWLKSNATMRNNQAFHVKTGLPISGMIIVNLFGQCADYEKINDIKNEWNLWVVEDACQSIGAHANKRSAGTFGDIACFSLYPTKNLGVFGDGGVVTTKAPHLAEEVFKLRNHGRKTHYDYECYGINSRLDAIQALVATKKLAMIDDLNNRRREIAQIYNKRLSELPYIKTPQEQHGYHVYHQYSIQVEAASYFITRDMLQQHLKQRNVGTNIVYPKALHQIPYLTPLPELATSCPVAEYTTKTILSLPIWPELTNQEVDYVCSCIEELAPVIRPNGKKEKQFYHKVK